MHFFAKKTTVFFLCLALVLAPEAFVSADFLSPSSQAKRIGEELERHSFMGLRPRGNRVMAPPTAIAEFEFEDGLYKGALPRGTPALRKPSP